jgi:sugar phosphate isomerase/epimerase
MAQPKIGLSMLYCLSEPFSKMVKRLATVETRYIEVLDDGLHALNKRRVAVLNETAKSHGLQYSVHAPFADINIASPSKPMLAAALKRLKKSIAHANALNAQLWILHPGMKTGISMFYPGEDWKQNLRSIQTLSETAEEYGVSLALENLPEKYWFIMKTPEDFAKFYAETGLEDIGIVLDVGHANLEGLVEPFLKQLPHKITHVHVSDNNGEVDQHLGLGYGAINWQQLAETLKSIGYDKAIVTESVDHVEETLQKMKQLFA